jgi:hypothetical protein
MKQFTQEEAQKMYQHLHTLVFALDDLQHDGLKAEHIPVGFRSRYLSLQRAQNAADKVLKEIDK